MHNGIAAKLFFLAPALGRSLQKAPVEELLFMRGGMPGDAGGARIRAAGQSRPFMRPATRNDAIASIVTMRKRQSIPHGFAS
jgi:hypothetical protein